MNLCANNQTYLYGLEDEFFEFVKLYDNKKLPNKILLSGQKGIGKCTLAYHLINFILSQNEDFSYNLKNLTINQENKSFRLIKNGSNPNFNLIDVKTEKKKIDIDQIRNLINNLNKSSLNSKPRFILIDNIEYLNLNSINALLKILEEPNENTYFILINNNKKITPTILSRCLNFKITLSNKKILTISNELLNDNINNLINKDLLNYYFTPGKIYNLVKFSKEKEINLSDINLNSFLSLLINKAYYKEDDKIKIMVYDFVESFLLKKISIIYSDLFSYFLKRINDTKNFNLDEESLFIEINSKLLNG
ncbi:MAG: AAA family ATPase [Candidatus Pelagibacter sp.]